jgi:hypothetical protein
MASQHRYTHSDVNTMPSARDLSLSVGIRAAESPHHRSHHASRSLITILQHNRTRRSPQQRSSPTSWSTHHHTLAHQNKKKLISTALTTELAEYSPPYSSISSKQLILTVLTAYLAEYSSPYSSMYLSLAPFFCDVHASSSSRCRRPRPRISVSVPAESGFVAPLGELNLGWKAWILRLHLELNLDRITSLLSSSLLPNNDIGNNNIGMVLRARGGVHRRDFGIWNLESVNSTELCVEFGLR